MDVDVTPAPWAPAKVPVAEIGIEVDWPRACPPRILRGAVLARLREVFGESLHSDWHGHLNGPEGGMSRPAPICYRIVAGRPRLYLWGDRAHDHARAVCTEVHALRLPGGGVLDVTGFDLDLRVDEAAVSRHWCLYRLVTPVYPSDVAWRRRPRAGGPFRAAWAGALLRRSILEVVAACGKGDSPSLPLHVHLEQYRDVPVRWDRPERNISERVYGFEGAFVANAILPSGIGLGHHRSEGWGEVRLVERGERL